jgi:hypothetical protein
MRFSAQRHAPFPALTHLQETASSRLCDGVLVARQTPHQNGNEPEPIPTFAVDHQHALVASQSHPSQFRHDDALIAETARNMARNSAPSDSVAQYRNVHMLG